MPIQTLNIIKNWFKTGFKPTQAQFWDTWDSFRHKFEKIPVKDVEGIDELLLSKADKTVLDNHLTDKMAHAPQINTDWNSESGFSKLLNKPDFKTINGEVIVGTGDITIKSNADSLWEAGIAANSVQVKGGENVASGIFSVAIGFNSKAEGNASHAEGDGGIASGYASHAEGRYPVATGFASHAEGANALAEGTASHAEGNNNQAKGNCSHAEGYSTIAKGDYSHSEGQGTKANGQGSHAEGHATIAEAEASHAGGAYSSANGPYSFVHGQNSKANGSNTIVFGKDITGSEDNTIYTDQLNIKRLGSNPPVSNLGLDATGNVVAGLNGGSQTLEQVLTKGNTDTTGKSIIMQQEWSKSEVKSDRISISYGKEDVITPDHFSLINQGDGGELNYVNGSGSGKSLRFGGNTPEGVMLNFDLPTGDVGGTLALVDNLTLQTVLNTGNTITSPDTFTMGYFDAYSMFYSHSEPDISTQRISVGIQMNNAVIEFLREGKYSRLLSYPNPTQSTDTYMPANGGELAVKQDITLQRMIDNGASATNGDSGMGFFLGNGPNQMSYIGMNNGLKGTSKSYSEFAQKSDSVSFGVYTGELSNVESKFNLSTASIDFSIRDGVNLSRMYFATPVDGSGSAIEIPSLPSARTYKMSVAEVFTDSTNVAHSSFALNSIYTQARIGDKVNCIAITTGPIQYEKTLTGWIQHSFTIVT